jgi:hypothetical protein
MKFRYFWLIIFALFLAACGPNIEQLGTMTSTAQATIATLWTTTPKSTATTTNTPTPIKSFTPTNTNTSVPTKTATATIRILPELGGSQAWIEKNFKPYGFEFFPPVNGERTSVLGKLTLQKDQGDPYDMWIEISTVYIKSYLIRAQLLVMVHKDLSGSEMSFVLELYRLLWATSTNTSTAPGWIDVTLPTLKPTGENQTVKASFGIVQSRMTCGIWNSGEGLGYSLTLAVPGED